MPVLLTRFRNPHRGSCRVHWTTPSSPKDCGYGNLKLAILRHHSETLLMRPFLCAWLQDLGQCLLVFAKTWHLLSCHLPHRCCAYMNSDLLWYKWHRHCFHACFRPRCGCGFLKGETFASGFPPRQWNQHLCKAGPALNCSIFYSFTWLFLQAAEFGILCSIVKVELTLSVVRVVDVVGESHAQVSLTLRLNLIFEIHTSCSYMHGTLSTPLEISDGVICCCRCLTSAWSTGLSLAFETINVKSITWYP